MDVNRLNGAGHQIPMPQQMPIPGSGEFAPAPPHHVVQEAAQPPEPTPTMAEIRAERAERADENHDTLRRAVSEINSSLAMYRRHLSIRMHEPTNRRIVTVYDSNTNEAVREIPPERVLEAHANMLELAGLFLDTRG